MRCGEFLVDLSKPGMYELKFTPKLWTAKITGSLGSCYAINFEKVGKGPRIRGFAYQHGRPYLLDGLPAGKYQLSAVTQRQSDNVFVSQAEVTLEAKAKATVDIVPAPKGSCSLQGYILGKQNKYKTPWPTSPESQGKWFILIRKRSSGAVKWVDAYEALTMDSLYVVRGTNIIQETQDRTRYHIEGVVPGKYTVTAIENPSWSGCIITRQQSKTLTLRAGDEAVLDFDLRNVSQRNGNPGVKDTGSVVTPGSGPRTGEEIESARRRVISFPEDRSMGKLFVRDPGADNWYEDWQELGEAIGDVSVDAGKEVKLEISEQAAGDLSTLDKLESDDLQMLSFGWKAMKVGSLEPIGNLKGLKALNIQRAMFDSDDLKYLTGLAQLQVLRFGDYNLTDESMRYVGRLTSLRSLALWGTGISDEGLKHLQGLTNLTFLALNRCEITDQGLNYLRNMTALEGLQIYQTKITDNGLEKLQGFTRLKHIKLDNNGITDAGLKHIENLTSLENIWINSNPITDKGLSYLTGMKNLKELYALHTKITDAGLANFKGVKDIRLVVNPGTAEKIESGAVQDIIFPAMTIAKTENSNNIESNVIVLRLIDSNGRPVSGAKVGNYIRTRDTSVLGSKLSWNLRGKENNVSNERGEITLTREKLFPPSWSADRKLALYVLHENRKIGATCMISKDGEREEINLTLEPVCRVHGKLDSKALRKIGRPLTWTNVYLYWDRDSHGVLSHMSDNKQFEFLVSPGRYTLNPYGSGEGSRTKQIYPEIEVKANQSELDLGVIDLPPTKITSLIGKPAIEFGPIKAWKNGPPVKLADLKGKAVIIYFDGDSPNTSRDLPRLVDLHNQFADKGLVIIALYNCPDMKYLDKKWIEIYERFGGVTDVPFRVAIDGGKSTFYEGTAKERLGATYGAYDITSDPTTILIDPEGKIVGSLNIRRAKEILEKMLDVNVKPAISAWRQRFEAVYSLEDDQILKRISPPYIPERRDYYLNEHSSQASRISRTPDRFIFHWTGKLKNWGLGFVNTNINSALYSVLRLNTFEYDVPEELQSLKMPGDWIVRDEFSKEAKLKALEQLLANEFGRNIRFEKRTVEREVIIAKGKFKFHPPSGTYESSSVHLFCDQVDPDEGAGGGTAYSVNDFLQRLGSRVKMPVIDKTDSSEQLRIPYRHHRSSMLRNIKDKVEKNRKLKVLLTSLTEQTELQLAVERRPVEIWFVTEKK
jgi:alkyl hydroperoxide reductase subunit AhpC